jgi:hypothetical protein
MSIRNKSATTGWGIQWHSKNLLDGRTEHLCGRARIDGHPAISGYKIMVFASRKDARDYLKTEFGYIAKRSDLKTEPHGWEVPRVVKVKVTVDLHR